MEHAHICIHGACASVASSLGHESDTEERRLSEELGKNPDRRHRGSRDMRAWKGAVLAHVGDRVEGGGMVLSHTLC